MAESPRVLRFFLLTFAITWGLQVPAVMGQWGWLPGPEALYLLMAALGVLGPLLAASLLSWQDGGPAALAALYAPLFRWRVHPGWYVSALLVPGLLLSALLWALNSAGRTGPVAYLPVGGAVAAGLFISVGEEVGWRGYALPRLQERWGPFAASCLLGVVWYLWHIPMLVGHGAPLDLVLVMLLMLVGGSLFFTWIYNGTRGSLLLAVLAHLGAHLNNSNTALPDEVVPLVAHAIVYAGLGLLVMRATLPKTSYRTCVECR